MKHIKKIMLTSVLAACSLFSFACKKDDASLTIQDAKVTGLQDFYYVTQDIDTSNVNVQLTLSNKTKINVNKIEYNVDLKDAKSDTQLIIYTPSTLVKTNGEYPVGEYTIKYIAVGYMTEKAELVKITVNSDQSLVYDLDSFALPTSIQAFKNLTFSASDEAKFYEADKQYFVGDDNEFIFKPLFELSNKEGNSVNTNLNTVVEIKYNNSIVGSEYYTYNPTTYGIDFTEAAVGKTFTIKSSAKDFEEDLNGNDASASFNVTVADGWNVTNAKDLGRMSVFGANEGINPELYHLIDNIPNHDTNGVWKRFLGISDADAKSVNGIFLHNDLNVLASDVPSEYFVTTDGFAKNSLKDYSMLYEKLMTDNNFTFNGNFFKVDFSNFPIGLSQDKVLYTSEDDAKLLEGHSRAFQFLGKMNDGAGGAIYDGQLRTTSKVYFKNVNFVGNIRYTSDKNSVYTNVGNTTLKAEFSCGGIIGVATEGLDTTYDGVLAKNMYIPYYADGNARLTINKAKAYDCFNCAMYDYRAPLINIASSEFKRFGGPAIFLNSNPNIDDDSSNVVCNIDSSTKIENYIKPNSAWFSLYNATELVSRIIQNEGFAENLIDHLYYEVKGETTNRYLRYTELLAEELVTSREDLEEKIANNTYVPHINFISIGFSDKETSDLRPTRTILNYNANIPFSAKFMIDNSITAMPSNDTNTKFYDTTKNNLLYLILDARTFNMGMFAICLDYVPYEPDYTAYMEYLKSQQG